MWSDRAKTFWGCLMEARADHRVMKKSPRLSRRKIEQFKKQFYFAGFAVLTF
jgi:hypothetical protein